MARFMKHVGENHLGSKVVVVFRELPDDPDNCLIVESKTLSEMYHDQLMRVIESADAQQTPDLYTVLARRQFGDGMLMLQALHARGLLKKEKVDNIKMMPIPNRSAPLRTINEQIREVRVKKGEPASEIPKMETKAPAEVKDVQATTKEVTETTPEDENKSVAESKLLQARLMEEDAKKLRQEAYSLDPSLKKGGRPSKAQLEKAETIQSDS